MGDPILHEEEPELLGEQESEIEVEVYEEAESWDEDADPVPPPTVENLHKYEYTLALVKPHAAHLMSLIESIILEKGFTVIKKKAVKLSPEQAAVFFMKREQQDPVKVPRLVCTMVSGVTHVMILAREKAVRKWQHLMGPCDPEKARVNYPMSLRAKFGVDDLMNALYGSRNQDEAAEDIRFFFKDIIIKPNHSVKSLEGRCGPENSFLEDRVYLREFVYPTLQKGLVELVQTKPANAYEWFVNWLLENDPFSPKVKPYDLQKIPN